MNLLDKENPLTGYMEQFVESAINSIHLIFSESFTAETNDETRINFTLLERFESDATFIVTIPFSGRISGEFFLCLDKEMWQLFITNSLGVSATPDLMISAAKELLNTIVGTTIDFMNKDFPGLTFSAPRVVEGRMHYPEIRTIKCTLIHKQYHQVSICLTLDFMQQELGVKLEEEVRKAITESLRANKAETTIYSILNHINLGLFQIDQQGHIKPGCSSALERIFNLKMKDLEESLFAEICPPELIGDKKDSFEAWLHLVSRELDREESESKTEQLKHLMAISPLREAAFQRNGQDFIYHFSYFPVPDDINRGLLIMIEDITHKKLLQKKMMIEAEQRIQNETRSYMAKAFQQSLLPKNATPPGIEIATCYQPSEDVGGDWYGLYHEKSTSTLDLFMGDVTGQGISAALLTAVTCGAVYSIEMIVDRPGTSLTEERRLSMIAKTLDKVITQVNENHKNLSMVFMSLNLDNGQLHYLNAGHIAGFIINGNNREARTIPGPGSLPGGQEDPDQGIFAKRSEQLSEGDLIFLFTDGLIENPRPGGETLNLKRLKDLLSYTKAPDESLETVLGKARKYWENSSTKDDVALMALRWNRPKS